MVATFFIILCHILQHFNIELAWWFNVGVQMFLFISGYLYANKKIKDPIEFYKKTFIKILLDYYIYIFIFIIGFAIVNGRMMDFESTMGLLTFSSTVYGVNHFWFIPYILFCYLLTPLFSLVLDKIEKKTSSKKVICVALLLLVVYVAVYYFASYFKPAYIVCFVLGMILKRLEKRKPMWLASKVLIIILAMIMNGWQIYIVYMKGGELPKEFTAYAHVLLGIVVTYLLKDGFSLVGNLARSKRLKQITNRALDISDKYSYDVYIVHHIYIISRISLYAVLGGVIRPTIAILFLIVVSAKMLNIVSRFLFDKVASNFLK